jgi:hypothetical protein
VKKYFLNNDLILEFELNNFVTNNIINFIYETQDKNLGQYDGITSNTQSQNKSTKISSKYKKSNFNGFQSFEHNYIIKKEHIDESFVEFFEQVNTIVNSNFDNRFHFKLNNYWFNINKKGSYNKLHNHLNIEILNSGVSGVFYLKTPKNCGNIVFQSHDKKQLEIKSKEGHLLIFPIHLAHFVQESKSNEDRISLAFNYDSFVKDDKKNLV